MSGQLEAIVGCMFSGKSTALIKAAADLGREGHRLQCFKPALDTRYGQNKIVSHDQASVSALPVADAREILAKTARNTTAVLIDEIQFFDSSLPETLAVLVDLGKHVVVAGLDTDWRGHPFGPLPRVLAMADRVRRLYATCGVCGEAATNSQRIIKDERTILLGTAEYEPRCRDHFEFSGRKIVTEDKCLVSSQSPSFNS